MQRRKAVEPFERLWGLAYMAASQEGSPSAAEELRGITYAKAALRDFQQRSDSVTPDFKLLKYQGRTGAVGTYWTALAGGALIDPYSGVLLGAGEELAACFPPPPLDERDTAKLTDLNRAHRVTLSFTDLFHWARECHLSAAARAERLQLADALTADLQRECVAQALRAYPQERPLLTERWDISAVWQLREYLARDPTAAGLGLPIVLDAIVFIEQFHEAALAVFENARVVGDGEVPIPSERPYR